MLGRIKNIFRAKADTTPKTIEVNDRRLLEMLGINVDELNFRGENALKEATVFACIRILADSIGKLPVKVYKQNSTVDHYLTPLLKTRPNPWMSARDFFKALEVKRHLYGNAYAWLEFETKGKNAGKITGIYPLDSSKVEIYIDDIGLLPGKGRLWYVYKDNKGTEYRIDPDEILHFKGLTSDGIVGITPLPSLEKPLKMQEQPVSI